MPPLMMNEICEQPRVVQAVLKHEKRNIEALCKTIRNRDIHFIILAGRGTSDHAATVTKYLIEIVNGIPVSLAAPSVVTLYRSRLDFSKCLVVGISQSGQSTDVVEYMQQAKSFGALTVSISNETDSDLSRACEYNIFCHAGEERSVAATKTYTATLTACYLLSCSLAERSDLLDELNAIPDAISCALQTDKHIQEISQRYRFMEECFVLARGINHATGYEAALKIAETCYVGAHPFSTADFMHGPIAVVEEGTSCFVFAPSGKAFSTVQQTITALANKRAETIVYSDRDDALGKATIPVKIPCQTHELLTPLFYIVPAQIFACHLSLVKGYNPDRPRGLKKVTRTR